MFKDSLDPAETGKRWDPPISGDRVKKLLCRVNTNHWTKYKGRYYIWKGAEDPRERDEEGNIHWGVPKGKYGK